MYENYYVDEQEQETQSPPLTFTGVSRGVARFALLYGAGQSAVLCARSIPALQPVFGLLLAGGFLGAIAAIVLCRQYALKVMIALIAGLALLGVIGGSWDAIHAWVNEIQGQQEGLGYLVIGGSIAGAVAIDRFVVRGRRDE